MSSSIRILIEKAKKKALESPEKAATVLTDWLKQKSEGDRKPAPSPSSPSSSSSTSSSPASKKRSA